MKPPARAVPRRLLFGLPIDVLGAAVAYLLSGRWDFAVIVGIFLVAGQLNDTYGAYLVLKRKLDSESGPEK